MAAANNPFYVAPPDVLRALQEYDQSYKTASDDYRQSQNDAILKEVGAEIARGGISDTSLGKLFSMSRSAGVPGLNAAAHLLAAKQQGQGVYGTPIYGTDAEGNTVLGAIGKNGQFRPLDTGDVKVNPGIKIISTPQGDFAVDTRSGLPVGQGGPSRQFEPPQPTQQPTSQQPIRMPQNLTPEGAQNWIRGQNLQPGTPVILPDGRQGVVPGAPMAHPQQGGKPQSYYPKDYTVPAVQKEAAEKTATMGKARSTLDTSFLNFNQVEKQVDDLLNSPGLPRILGTMSYFPNVRGGMFGIKGDAANAQTKLDRLKSQVALESLTAMREASKTGGAVGQVTEREYPILESKFANLNQAQTEPEFRKAANDLKIYLKGLKANMQRAYDTDYGGLTRPDTPVQPGYGPMR